MELNSEGEDEEGIVALDDLKNCPEATKWKEQCRCCGKPVLLVMPVDRLFCEHWEMDLCMPIFVQMIVVFGLSMYVFATLLYLPSTVSKIVSSLEVLSTFSLFLWSYFAAMCMDPGFLPYTWVLTKRYQYTWQEQLEGMAIRPDQTEFAQKHKPPFASFSHYSGRYVMRADHVCYWIANWIGKRNHKQFILVALWGTLFSLSLIAWRFFRTENLMKTHKALFCCDMIAALVELIFVIMLPIVFAESLWDLAMNQTQIEKWRGVSGEALGCCDSFREVCGKDSFCLWLFPTPAFGENPYE